MFGENILPFLTLALGGALAVGNIMALVRPQQETAVGDLEAPIVWRSAIQIVIGLVVSIWAIASLLS